MSDSTLLLSASGLVFIGLGIAAGMLFLSSAQPTGVAKSLANIEVMHGRRGVAASEQSFSDRVVRPALGRMAWLGRKLTPVGTPARLQRRLDLAGNPEGWSIERMLGVKAMGLVGLGLFGFYVLLRLRGVAGAGWLVGGSVAGFWLPDVLLYNAGLKRQKLIQRSAPDALDMLTVCVEAGLGFDAGLAQVARNTTGPLAGEFARSLQEMQIGKSRVTAFEDLAVRTTVPELQVFVAALVQSDKLGIPVANVLREQAAEMRLKRRQRAEEQAQKVPIKILFPLLFCIFPALFVVIIGPGGIQIARAFGAMK